MAKGSKTNGNNRMHPAVQWMRNNIIEWLSILGVMIGLIVGLLSRLQDSSETTVRWVSLPGHVLENMMEMLVLPFVIASIITAAAKLNLKAIGILGWRLILLYFVCTLAAVIFGLISVAIVHPGAYYRNARPSFALKANGLDVFLDFFKNMLPQNLVQATFQQVRTKYVPKKVTKMYDQEMEPQYEIKMVPVLEHKLGTNLFGLIVFGTAFGVIAGHMGRKSQILVEFFSIFQKVMYRLAQAVLSYFPFGVIFLLVGNIIETETMNSEIATDLYYYILAIIVGTFFHIFVFLPLLYFIAVRQNPFHLYKNIFYAQVVCFGTGSRTASIPASVYCLKTKCKVDERVSLFVLPVGAVLNLGGTALCQTITAIFITQLKDISLNFGQYLLVGLTSFIASFASEAIPLGGSVGFVLALKSVGVETNGFVSLLFSLGWIMERLCALANITADLVTTTVVFNWSKPALDKTAPFLHLNEVTKYIDEDDDDPRNGSAEGRV